MYFYVCNIWMDASPLLSQKYIKLFVTVFNSSFMYIKSPLLYSSKQNRHLIKQMGRALMYSAWAAILGITDGPRSFNDLVAWGGSGEAA